MCETHAHLIEDERQEDKTEEKHIYVTFDLDGHVVDDIMDQYVWGMERFVRDTSKLSSKEFVLIIDRKGVAIAYVDKWKENKDKYAGRICIVPQPDGKRYTMLYGNEPVQHVKVIIHKTPR